MASSLNCFKIGLGRHRRAHQIRNIRVYKRGHDGIQVMTIHYEVQVDFNNIASLSAYSKYGNKKIF